MKKIQKIKDQLADLQKKVEELEGKESKRDMKIGDYVYFGCDFAQPDYSHLIGEWVGRNDDQTCYILAEKIEDGRIIGYQYIFDGHYKEKEFPVPWSVETYNNIVPFLTVAPYIIKEAEKRYKSGYVVKSNYRNWNLELKGSPYIKDNAIWNETNSSLCPVILYSDNNQWAEIISKPEEIEEGYYWVKADCGAIIEIARYDNSKWHFIGSNVTYDRVHEIIRRVEL